MTKNKNDSVKSQVVQVAAGQPAVPRNGLPAADTVARYAREIYRRAQHHRRFAAYVEAHGLACQECGGHGGWTNEVMWGQGPWEECFFCEGTGRTTRWLRGVWLRWKRSMKRTVSGRLSRSREMAAR